MRQKFFEHGPEIFDTYELLEMILYTVIAAKDTNPVAKRLLAAFGSLEGVLSAKREELTAVEGVGNKTADMLISLGSLLGVSELKTESFELKFDNYEKVGEYFVRYFEGVCEYRVAVMMLDNSMKLIGAFTIYDGIDYQSAGVKGGKFVELAIRHGASVMIIAHNHPYGPLYPTEGDMKTNSSVMCDLSDVGVLLADHYIVSGERYIGFMASIKKKFSQQPELSRFYESKTKSLGGGENEM